MLVPLFIMLVMIAALAETRPTHYDARYPQLSPEERHRIYMMHVINQQFVRVAGDGYSDSDELDVYTKRLFDIAFHLAQWHLTPPCGADLEELNNATRQIFRAYYSNDRLAKDEAIGALRAVLTLP